MTNQKLKILVVGSFVMDLIVKTNQFPQTGETVLGYNFSMVPGGKGANQSIQAAKAGSNVTMIGCVGDDAYGRMMLDAAKKANVDVAFVQIDPSHPSAIGNVQVETPSTGGAQNRIVVVSGANMSLTPESVTFLEDYISEYQMVLLQLEIPMAVNKCIAAYAAAKHVDVMLNPAPADDLDDDLLKNITYLVPNEHELARLTGTDIRREGGHVDLDTVTTAAKLLLARGVKKVLVTLGDCGSLLVEEHKNTYCAARKGIAAVDPTGAGDSYIGAFAAARTMGQDDKAAMEMATAAASITVTKTGAQNALPSYLEIAQVLKQWQNRQIT